MRGRDAASQMLDRTFVNKFIIRKARLIRWEKITFLIFLTLLHTAVRRGFFFEKSVSRADFEKVKSRDEEF